MPYTACDTGVTLRNMPENGAFADECSGYVEFAETVLFEKAGFSDAKSEVL